MIFSGLIFTFSVIASFDFNKSWNKDLDHPNVKVFSGVSDLRKFCREQKYDDIWVIGGGEIYNKFLHALLFI